MLPAVQILPENPRDDALVDALHERALGPNRFVRAAHHIREQGPHRRDLSFAAWADGLFVGSVRMTPIAAGAGRGLLLGPLAVEPALAGRGVGKTLLRRAVEAARDAGEALILLVGDEPYYGPFGFRRVPDGRIDLPRPYDPDRLLACELRPGALDAWRGMVTHLARAEGEPAGRVVAHAAPAA